MIPALELRRVSWGPTRCEDAIRGISLSVPRGQILAVCGGADGEAIPIMRLMARQIAPRRGSVLLDGRDIWLLDGAEVEREVAVLRAAPVVDPKLTVVQVAAIGGPSAQAAADQAPVPNQPDSRRSAGRALRHLGLESLADLRFGAIPPAQQQRTLLAGALTRKARIIIIETPIPEADIEGWHETMALLRGFRPTIVAGVSCPRSAAGFADRLLMIAGGQVQSDIAYAPSRHGSAMPSMVPPAVNVSRASPA